jgi:endonuclease YncB( thermonuclease family)
MKPFPIVLHVALVMLTVGFQAHQRADTYAHFPPERGPQTLLVMGVVDGDTVDAAYLVPVRIRLYGCNAPEKNTDEGKRSAAALATILKPERLWHCELKGREKFGRQLGDFRGADDKSVTTMMIGAGHAKPWDGTGPRP